MKLGKLISLALLNKIKHSENEKLNNCYKLSTVDILEATWKIYFLKALK